MAQKLSCVQSVYSNYELGQLKVPVDTLIYLARFYGTTMDYLLELTNVREQPSGWGKLSHRKIRDLREDADLRQIDIARYLQCSRNGYSNYERSHREIPVKYLVRLAKFYHTTTDYLLGLTDSRDMPYK